MKKLQLPLSLVFICSILLGARDLPLIKVSEDSRYLVTDDGEPFFWLGGTAWELLHRLTREETEYYLSDRADKGFNVIQTVILAELDGLNTPNAYGNLPLIEHDPVRINEAYFEHVDFVIKKAEEYGIYLGLLPTWGDKFNKAWGEGPEIFTPENAEVYGEILGRRYHDRNNIIWILGGDRWPEDQEDTDIINAMAQGIRNADPRHLITYHPSGGHKATDFFNDSWLDIDMFQTGHDRTTKDYEYVRSSRNVMPARPVINGEPRYENHPDRFKPDIYGWMDDTDVRCSAWWSMLSGAAGYTYGCHDIWQMFTKHAVAINGARTDWKESVHLPGSRQLSYMKQLLESLPWQEMINDQSLLLTENKSDSSYIVCSISKRKDVVLVYSPIGKPISLDLTGMIAERIRAYWYNPRDGESIDIGEYTISEVPKFTPWSLGRGSDFVLVAVDVNTEYTLP